MTPITKISKLIHDWFFKGRINTFSSSFGTDRREATECEQRNNPARPPFLRDETPLQEHATGPEEMDRGVPDEEWDAYLKLSEAMTSIDILI